MTTGVQLRAFKIYSLSILRTLDKAVVHEIKWDSEKKNINIRGSRYVG